MYFMISIISIGDARATTIVRPKGVRILFPERKRLEGISPTPQRPCKYELTYSLNKLGLN